MDIITEETLFDAFFKGEGKLILDWLKNNPDKCNIKDPLRGITLFSMACYFGEEEIIDYLFTQNIDIHQKDKTEKNVLIIRL